MPGNLIFGGTGLESGRLSFIFLRVSVVIGSSRVISSLDTSDLVAMVGFPCPSLSMKPLVILSTFPLSKV